MKLKEFKKIIEDAIEENGEDTEVMLEYDGGHYPASRAMPVMFGIYKWRSEASPEYRWCDGSQCSEYRSHPCNSGHVMGLEIT